MKFHIAALCIMLLCLSFQQQAQAQRYIPANLCAINNNNDYESITPPLALGGEYQQGSTQSITVVVGDTQSPGGNQAFTGDTENVVIFLDSNNDSIPESLSNTSCTYNQGASPAGCSTTQNITIPTVTEDTTFRGRVMLSFGDLNPTNGCGTNGFGDSIDYLIVANVDETITIEDVSSPEDGGVITLEATLSHDVSDAFGFAPFTVDYQTVDGTATTADNDYTAATGTLTFNGQAGDKETFTITPTADTLPEGDQTLVVELLNLSNTTHGIDISDNATVTLTEDDEEVALDIVKTADNLSPNIGDTIEFTLTVTNAGPSTAVSVSVQDIVPAGFGAITPTTAPADTTFIVTGNTIDWTDIEIPPSSNVSASFTVTVLPP